MRRKGCRAKSHRGKKCQLWLWGETRKRRRKMSRFLKLLHRKQETNSEEEEGGR